MDAAIRKKINQIEWMQRLMNGYKHESMHKEKNKKAYNAT